MGAKAWLYFVVGALVIYWIFGRHVTATVTVPEEEIRIRVPVASPTALTDAPADAAMYEFANELPVSYWTPPSAFTS